MGNRAGEKGGYSHAVDNLAKNATYVGEILEEPGTGMIEDDDEFDSYDEHEKVEQ